MTCCGPAVPGRLTLGLRSGDFHFFSCHVPGSPPSLFPFQSLHTTCSISGSEMGDNSLSSLWDFLRQQGLQDLAVDLIRHGIRSRDDIARDASSLIQNGMSEATVTRLLEGLQTARPQHTPGRADLPVQHPCGQRASITLALVAAQPNNRKRSLDNLDQDILARTSQPAQASRLRTFRALCAAWQVAPFPLTVEAIRCCSASLKAGGYRSASLYLQAAVNYQIRHLHEQVHPLIRSTIKDCVRSIRRGLGPSRLKEGFDVFALADAVDVDDQEPFDMFKTSHMADVFIVGCWFMMREIEMAGALRHHLTLEGNEVRMLIPVHKTSSWGSLTSRTLRCPCKTLVHRLCPWHAAERHLIRVNCITQGPSRSNFPLIPDRHGGVVTKLAMVTALRNLLQQVGIQVHITTDEDKQIPRFGGHSVRVSGAMMLASAKVPVHLIQLMGRWSSAAVERYVQAAPMVALPSLPSGVLGQADVSLPPAIVSSSSAMSQTPTMTSVPQTPNNIPNASNNPSRVSEVKNRLGHLEEEVIMIRELIKKPEMSLIVRPRSRVVHKPSVDEQSNLPQVWQTKCGWSYGCTKFFRLQVLDSGFQPCKKCFPEQDGSFTADPEIDGSSGSDPSSSDSSSSEESG